MRAAAAAALALWAAGCATADAPPGATARQPRSQPADDDLLEVVPGDAEALLSLDVAQLRGSRWTKDLLGARGGSVDRGFDEAGDVDRVVFARLASLGEAGSLTVAQGRFDRDRVLVAFRRARPSARPTDARGRALWADGAEALAFLTDRTLLSGPATAVRSAIEASLGRAPAARGQRWVHELETWLARGRGARGPAVAVAVLVTEPVRERLRQELGEAETLERLGARLDLGPSLEVGLLGTTGGRREAAALASRLTSLLHGLRARASLAVLGLVPVLDGTRVASEGPLVRGTLRLDERQRDDIAARLAAAARILADRKGAPE